MQRRFWAVTVALTTSGGLQQTAKLTAQQQATPQVTTTGPTMQQTVNFMAELYAKQGVVATALSQYPSVRMVYSTSLKLEGECSLVVRQQYRSTDSNRDDKSFRGMTSVLDLTKSEPTSVAVKPMSLITPPLYELEIEQAYKQVRSGVDAANEDPPVVLAAGAKADGVVQSNDGTTILFVNGDGQRVSYTPGKGAKLRGLSTASKPLTVTVSDFHVGDMIFIDKKEVRLSKSEPPPPSFAFASFGLFQVANEEAATRLARALIHAMVLCHKDEMPAPF